MECRTAQVSQRAVPQDTMIAVYNDLESVKQLLEESNDEVAAVIVEPVSANMGVVPPKDGFLEDCVRHR